MENDNAEIRVDTRISTDIKVSHNKPDIVVLDKKRKEILIVEVGIITHRSSKREIKEVRPLSKRTWVNP